MQGTLWEQEWSVNSFERNIDEFQRPERCEPCFLGYAQRDITSLDQQQEYIEQVSDGGKTHKCQDCHQQFRKAVDLEHHAQTWKCRAYACDHPGCSKAFVSRTACSRHRKHHSEPLTVCKHNGCAKTFTRQDHYKSHFRHFHRAAKSIDPDDGLAGKSAFKDCGPALKQNITSRAGGERLDVDLTGTYLDILYKPDDIATIDLDIVAIHGLNSGPYTSFTSRDSTKTWLEEDLPRSVPNARISTFSWDDSAFTRPIADTRLHRGLKFADEMLDRLSERRVEDGMRSCPIIFIAHNLGGIMLKAAIRRAHQRPSMHDNMYDDIFKSAKFLMFFGTPHQGAEDPAYQWNLETSLQRIGKAVGIGNKKLIAKLKSWSGPIADLCDDFTELAPRFRIGIFCESVTTDGTFPVTPTMARIPRSPAEPIFLNSEHASLTKDALKQVSKEILEFLNSPEGQRSLKTGV